MFERFRHQTQGTLTLFRSTSVTSTTLAQVSKLKTNLCANMYMKFTSRVYNEKKIRKKGKSGKHGLHGWSL